VQAFAILYNSVDISALSEDQDLRTAFLSFYIFLQASMDLPPDKAKLLRNYDDEKKWDMICDQVSNMH